MIPLDFPGCYAHSVRLSLAASEIGDCMDAAAVIFRRRDVREGTAVVWCNDTTPFSSYPAAALKWHGGKQYLASAIHALARRTSYVHRVITHAAGGATKRRMTEVLWFNF